MNSETSHDLPTLRLDGPLPWGRFVIEASAGTGKTYSLTALVARQVAENGLRPDQLLMVTFTRSAATDMRHRTRLQVRALATALQASIEGTEIESEPWMAPVITGDGTEDALRLERLEAFIATYDEATISTIHGFLQIVLNRVGLSSPVHGEVSLVEDPSTLIRQVVSDLVIGALAEDPLMFDGLPTSTSKNPLTIGSTLKALVSATKTVLGNLDSVIQPMVDDVDVATSLSKLPGEKRWAVLVERAVRTVRDRLDQSEQLGFDGLVTATRDLLQGPDADVVVASLRQQFRVVMVDEFQDTDHVQWAILSRLFLRGDSEEAGTAFGTVGDPKQAIYRFRGADIEAYHEATFGVEQTSALITNYRSNASWITAVNSLFEGVRFGSDDIVYRSVTARSGVAEEGVVGSPVLEIRWVPHSEEAGSAQSQKKSPTK
ncbi:MAG: UvrD-helicase domain-containing protein, partial [Actinomycetota bacterium]